MDEEEWWDSSGDIGEVGLLRNRAYNSEELSRGIDNGLRPIPISPAPLNKERGRGLTINR